MPPSFRARPVICRGVLLVLELMGDLASVLTSDRYILHTQDSKKTATRYPSDVSFRLFVLTP